MFQFPAFAPAIRRCQAFSLTGCPIRTPPDHYLFAVPRRFSQLTTSFFASRSLGILRPPLFPSSRLLDPLISFFVLPPEAVRPTAGLKSGFREIVLLRPILLLPRYLFPILSNNFPEPLSAVPMPYLAKRQERLLTRKVLFLRRNSACQTPKRRCSSHTFRYGYLVTT